MFGGSRLTIVRGRFGQVHAHDWKPQHKTKTPEIILERKQTALIFRITSPTIETRDKNISDPLEIKEQLQNKRHDVAYFLAFQWIGEACSSISLFLK